MRAVPPEHIAVNSANGAAAGVTHSEEGTDYVTRGDVAWVADLRVHKEELTGGWVSGGSDCGKVK